MGFEPSWKNNLLGDKLKLNEAISQIWTQRTHLVFITSSLVEVPIERAKEEVLWQLKAWKRKNTTIDATYIIHSKA